jgi:hypothetical protein
VSEKVIQHGHLYTPVSVKNHKVHTGTGNYGFLHPAVCTLSARSWDDADVTEFLNFRHNSLFPIYRSFSIKPRIG